MARGIKILKKRKREKEGEPDPIDYVLPTNIKEYYRRLRNLKELENYNPESENEKIKIYEQVVDKATIMHLITENDYTDKITEYSKKLSDIFEGSEDEDKKMKRKAYLSISKDPDNYLETTREFYGDEVNHITEAKEDKMESILKRVEEEK